MTKDIIILGTGGNCIDILDTINDINDSKQSDIYRCIGFLDDNELKQDQEYHGVKVLGPLASANEYEDCIFVNGIGSTHNFWNKQNIISKTGIADDKFETIVHPTASVSRLCELGRGTVVFQNVTITSNVQIGNHVIVLPNSIISHDGIIGSYTCIAGGACISGFVEVGESCYIGTNATIRNNVKIGKYSLIGMGSVVLQDVPENTVVVGNPAKVIRNTISSEKINRD